MSELKGKWEIVNRKCNVRIPDSLWLQRISEKELNEIRRETNREIALNEGKMQLIKEMK